MINEDVNKLTAGTKSRAEEVAYKYKLIERTHKRKYLFSPFRVLHYEGFIKRYLDGNSPFPLSIEIDPSNKCNHNCRFCIYSSLHSSDRNETISKETLLSLVNETYELGCKSILFVGGGEPLTNENTIDAIELANSLNISVGLVTNGSLLTEKIASRLKKATTYIRFSIDAANSETHHYLHRRNDLSVIIQNLKYLIKTEGKSTVGTSFFINEKNVDEIIDGVKLIKKCGADYIQFKTYSGLQIESALYDKVLNQIDKAIEYSDNDFDVFVMDRIFHNSAFQIRGYSKCHWQAFKTIINADGSVYLCAQMRNEKRGIIGNINADTLKNIWDGNNRRKIIANFDLLNCPYCVHNTQNEIIDFYTTFKNPHNNFF